MRMKLILALTLVSTQAFALNRTFLLMPADREYMNFVMKKYLSWHRENFEFPAQSPLFEELVQHIDHYVVKDSVHRQVTLNHTVDEAGKLAMSFRLFVHPDLRNKKEFQGAGLPDHKNLWFLETHQNGKICLLYREKEKELTSYCRSSGNNNFKMEWKETEAKDFPEGWSMPFPRMSIDVILRHENNDLKKVSFFQVSAHPSRIPKQLLRSVFLHTKDALFPLERITVTREGKMTIHYP